MKMSLIKYYTQSIKNKFYYEKKREWNSDK